MKILCTHNDGGVGKTTLAVHAAGVLIDQLTRTLLVDCDDQADFWQFYAGQNPKQDKDVYIDNTTTIIRNKNRTSIKKLVNPLDYEHIILDMDSPLQNTVQLIVGNDPDLILVPINKSQKDKSLRNLPRILQVIARIESKAGYLPKVFIIPLGISRNDIFEVVQTIDYKNKPKNYDIASEIRDVQEQMQKAIYKDRKYIWDYEGYEDIYDLFFEIVGS